MEKIDQFLIAKSRCEIAENLTQICNRLGFDYYIYTPLFDAGRMQKVFESESKVLEAEDLIAQNTFLTYPSSWLQRYQEAQHQEIDPVLKNLRTSILPVFWDDTIGNCKKNVVLNEACDHGLKYGITVSVFGHGGRRAVLSFARAQRLRESRAEIINNAGIIQLIAHHVLEAVHRVTHIGNELTSPVLSIREKDCLRWAACGKTSWEIGQILCISERTIVFHLTNATRKLQAANRREAVVRALNLRLISL